MGLVERCPHPPARSLVTLGAPHRGVFGLPGCSTAWCAMVRSLLSWAAYTDWLQSRLTPAQYWHDPTQPANHAARSTFLAPINNAARGRRDPRLRRNLLRLQRLVLVAWAGDTFLQPANTAHFGYYRPGQAVHMEQLEESPLWRQDWLGLRQLDARGDLHRLTMEGDHMNLDIDWIRKNIVIPFLQ